MKSLLQTEKECWFCGKTSGLHHHEVFYGTAFRQKSIDYGCQVWLCGEHHNLSNNGVHFNNDMDLELKKYAQMKFEEKYSHELFMEVFKKNYV